MEIQEFYKALCTSNSSKEGWVKFVEDLSRIDRQDCYTDFYENIPSKPEWKDAPDWAYFLHLDKLYRWWWLEFPPKSGDDFFRGGRVLSADQTPRIHPPYTETRPS